MFDWCNVFEMDFDVVNILVLLVGKDVFVVMKV